MATATCCFPQKTSVEISPAQPQGYYPQQMMMQMPMMMPFPMLMPMQMPMMQAQGGVMNNSNVPAIQQTFYTNPVSNSNPNNVPAQGQPSYQNSQSPIPQSMGYGNNYSGTENQNASTPNNGQCCNDRAVSINITNSQDTNKNNVNSAQLQRRQTIPVRNNPVKQREQVVPKKVKVIRQDKPVIYRHIVYKPIVRNLIREVPVVQKQIVREPVVQTVERTQYVQQQQYSEECCEKERVFYPAWR